MVPAFDRTVYRLLVRYSLSVAAFGAPGEGEIWVGSKEVSWTIGQVAFVPGRNRELILFQQGSKRLLSAQLPPPDAASPRQVEDGGGSLASTRQGTDEEGDRLGAKAEVTGCTPVGCLGSCPSALSCFSVAGDGTAVAAADEEGAIRVWSLVDGQVKLGAEGADWAPQNAGRPLIHSLAFADSQLLVAACCDGAVRIWACHCPPSLQLVDTLTTLERSPLVGLAVHWLEEGQAFASQGEGLSSGVIAAGAANGMLHVWKALSGGRWQLVFVADHAAAEGSLTSLAFSPGGTLLASAAAGGRSRQRPAEYDSSSANEEEELGGIGEEMSCPIRVYETSRWACLAAHFGVAEGPVTLHFAERRDLTGGASTAPSGGGNSPDASQSLLVLAAHGPPCVVQDPEKAVAAVKSEGTGPQVPDKRDAMEGVNSIDSDRTHGKQGPLSRKEPNMEPVTTGRPGLSSSDRRGPLEVESEEVMEERLGDLRATRTVEGSSIALESGVGGPRPSSKRELLGVQLAGEDLEEEQDGAPTPSPLPARLADNALRATSKAPALGVAPLQRKGGPPVTGRVAMGASPGSAGAITCQLSAPALHSTARLLVQLEQLQAQQFDSAAALQSVAMGSRPASVKADLAGLAGGLSLGDFARLGGAGTGDQPQYTGLTPLEDEMPPEAVPRPIGKQVDARWQAALAQPPQLDALWNPQERCPQVCDVTPVYCPSKGEWDQTGEHAMAAWSCLAAMPR
ncbi:hypothetical protein KFL_008690040 [Klebsormidium nitens]|uniref:Uncharacterized protein n=1 Tax=Klebsormidium nitens TaxID=105231 RepID=A0A1Y1IMI2_KLENI|nr:hypothetical protein KFL_008690040 [Klebsormidium nitens]|eukprot:GAQ91853.1 hypothetical protein KFL_008690040 [Klebsormidium nitens]